MATYKYIYSKPMIIYHQCDIKNIIINKDYPGVIQIKNNTPSTFKLFFILKTI